MWFTIGLAVCILLVLLLLEWRSHTRSLASVCLRVHVHGSRGKTSLTRELAQRLRQRGLRTLARTTGDQAEWILPDGSTKPWKRRGPGRVLEYVAIVRRAAALRCDALVVECMALHPETMHMASKLLDAHVIVITNTRPDHQEVMGCRAEDVATAFVNLLLPKKALACGKTAPVLVVQQDAGSHVLVNAASERGFRVLQILQSTRQPWERAAELAFLVEQALYTKAAPFAPQQCAVQPFPALQTVPERPLFFLDLFSVNDVQSAAEMLQGITRSIEPSMLCLPWVALLASRQDRPLRTRAFVAFIAAEPLFTHALPLGSHVAYAWLCLPRGKRLPWSLSAGGVWRGPAWTFHRVQQTLGPCVVVGLGNAHGQGELYRRFVHAQAEMEAVC